MEKHVVGNWIIETLDSDVHETESAIAGWLTPIHRMELLRSQSWISYPHRMVETSLAFDYPEDVPKYIREWLIRHVRELRRRSED